MNRRSLFKFHLITRKIYMNVFQVCEVGVGGEWVCVGMCTCLYACMHIRVNTCACFYSYYYVSWWCCHAKWAYLSDYQIHYYSHFNSAHIYVKRRSHCSLNIMCGCSRCHHVILSVLVTWLADYGCQTDNMPSQSQLLPGDIQTAQTTSHSYNLTKDQTKSQNPFSNLDSKVTEVTILTV